MRRGLASVEEMLRASVHSSYPFVTETSRHLVDAGGKRFRPLVVLLASAFGDPDAPAIVPAAVAIELTHLSTLYHDDVMDEAVLRRGAVSANARWTNSIAILTGDFLFARASEITADLGTDATRILAQTIAHPLRGADPRDGRPGLRRSDRALPPGGRGEDGFAHRDLRPAGRIAVGRFGGAVSALTAFGERIGGAFQLSDDLLDITSPSGESGKNPGTDLREGVRTLPVLFAEADGLIVPDDLSDDAVLAAHARRAAVIAGDRARPRGTRAAGRRRP